MAKVCNAKMPRTARASTVLTVLLGLWLPAAGEAQLQDHDPPRPLIEVRTSLGTMVWALYNETPVYRDHFLARVASGSMDSLLFHRVVPGFVVEGGDPGSRRARPGVALGLDPDSMGLALEVVPGLIHKKGALAAAPAVGAEGSADRAHRERFFLVHGVIYDDRELDLVVERKRASGSTFGYTPEDRRIYGKEGGQPRLDGSCTVFGEVVSGLDVLEAITRMACNEWDRPLEDIRMHLRKLP